MTEILAPPPGPTPGEAWRALLHADQVMLTAPTPLARRIATAAAREARHAWVESLLVVHCAQEPS